MKRGHENISNRFLCSHSTHLLLTYRLNYITCADDNQGDRRGPDRSFGFASLGFARDRRDLREQILGDMLFGDTLEHGNLGFLGFFAVGERKRGA